MLAQSFQNFEHIMIDGASTDGSLEVLAQYPHLTWISEPDDDPNHAFDKAFRRARGEYVTVCPVSDGYLSRNWFARSIKTLDENPEISLVWGPDALMTEDGDLFGLVFPQFHRKAAPSGRDFLPYWLATHLWFPEQNYVIRRSVMAQLWPNRIGASYFDQWNPFLRVILEFNKRGFLAECARIIPSYRRLHRGSVTERQQEQGLRTVAMYVSEIEDYARAVLDGRTLHHFRNGAGEVIGELAPSQREDLAQQIAHWRATDPIHGTDNLR